ncbi:hypothetical protein BGY98DRAFT_668917 [Russula aff. rugulosa BPL654]|nr:hypothetical protein BGY98DRAFT_668917 [Russula aff. rugulosa BPL654]
MSKNDRVPPFTGNEDWTERWQLGRETRAIPILKLPRDCTEQVLKFKKPDLRSEDAVTDPIFDFFVNMIGLFSAKKRNSRVPGDKRHRTRCCPTYPHDCHLMCVDSEPVLLVPCSRHPNPCIASDHMELRRSVLRNHHRETRPTGDSGTIMALGLGQFMNFERN